MFSDNAFSCCCGATAVGGVFGKVVGDEIDAELLIDWEDGIAICVEVRAEAL